MHDIRERLFDQRHPVFGLHSKNVALLFERVGGAKGFPPSLFQSTPSLEGYLQQLSA